MSLLGLSILGGSIGACELALDGARSQAGLKSETNRIELNRIGDSVGLILFLRWSPRRNQKRICSKVSTGSNLIQFARRSRFSCSEGLKLDWMRKLRLDFGPHRSGSYRVGRAKPGDISGYTRFAASRVEWRLKCRRLEWPEKLERGKSMEEIAA